MLDHNVIPVVGISRNEVHVHNFAIGNGAHFVKRFAARVALQRPNVDPFVKSRVNNSFRRLNRIAHETVLAAFPRRRFHAFVIALDGLVERRAAAAKERVVIRRQGKIDNLVLREHRNVRPQRQCKHSDEPPSPPSPLPGSIGRWPVVRASLPRTAVTIT